MARSGVTYDQVAAVADGLEGEGIKPSIRNVREKLGTGSPNTIQKHLAKFRQLRPPTAAAAPELPQALIVAISAEIERAASAARATVEERLVDAQSESDELAAEGEALEVERDSLVEQVEALTRERDTESGRATQLANDLMDAQKRVEREQQAAEAARVDLATFRLKVESQAERLLEYAAEIQELRENLAEAVKGRTVAEQQAAVLAARLESAADQLAKAESRAEQVEAKAVKSVTLAESKVEQAEGKALKLAQAIDEIREAASQEVRKVIAERDEARTLAADAREQVASLMGRLEGLGKRRERVEEKNKSGTD